MKRLRSPIQGANGCNIVAIAIDPPLTVVTSGSCTSLVDADVGRALGRTTRLERAAAMAYRSVSYPREEEVPHADDA
jgi:hypothetical protein